MWRANYNDADHDANNYDGQYSNHYLHPTWHLFGSFVVVVVVFNPNNRNKRKF